MVIEFSRACGDFVELMISWLLSYFAYHFFLKMMWLPIQEEEEKKSHTKIKESSKLGLSSNCV